MSDTFRFVNGVPHIGDKAFPWATNPWMDKPTSRKYERGFHLRFENGWLVSVQFGPGDYCDNYHADFNTGGAPESKTAEMWGWYGDSDDNPRWRLEDGDVIGYQTADQALAIIDAASKWPSAESVEAS